MPAGPAPTTATRSGRRGNGGGGELSADTNGILTPRRPLAPEQGPDPPRARHPGGPVSVVVVATITPKADQVDAVRDALLAAVPKVHAEPGCALYAVHEGDGQFVMVERWESAEALKVHGKAEA